MIRRIALAFSVAFLLPSLSLAADTYTTNYNLVLPAIASPNWGPKLNTDTINIDTAMAAIAVSTGAEAATRAAADTVLSASTASLANVKASTGTCTLPNFPITLNSGGVICQQPSNVSGSAATAGSATTATNIAGGAANSIAVQSGTGATGFLATGTGVVAASGGAPAYTTTPTLTGTNFSAIPESAITGLTTDIASKASTGTVVSISTIIVNNNGVPAGPYANGYYPNTAIVSVGNINAPYQPIVLQNLSNGTNASTNLILNGDLSGNTSGFLEVGVNSSKFSQTGQSVEKSSSGYVATSDSDLNIWAGTNGGLNGSQSEKLIFGSSNASSANAAAILMEATAGGPGAWVYRSSVTISTSGASGYSLETSSGAKLDAGNLLVASGSVCFGDTSHCFSTVPGAGTGDMVQAGNNVVTGSIRYGPATWTSGAINEIGKAYNQWQIVGSTYLVNAASVSFVAPSFSSASWRFYTQGMTGAGSTVANTGWLIRFNNDSGSNYLTQGRGTVGNGAEASGGSGQNVKTTGCRLDGYTGQATAAGDVIEIHVQDFRPMSGKPGWVNIRTDFDFHGIANGYQTMGLNGCQYEPAASGTPITTISLIAPSGMTGWFKLEKLEESYAQ